jgi:hypothetical protein
MNLVDSYVKLLNGRPNTPRSSHLAPSDFDPVYYYMAIQDAVKHCSLQQSLENVVLISFPSKAQKSSTSTLVLARSQ